MKMTTILAVLAAATAAATCPDLTSSLEFVCAPNVERWPSSEVARHVPDLCLYQGKIYQSGGEWEYNSGPCPIFAIEPYTGNWVQEWSAGTDATYDFHEFSDGRLYLSAVDIKERDWDNGQTEAESHEGSHFRREADGNWRAYETACTKGNISNWFGFEYQGYRTHNWDMAEYKGYTFICGYGISGSTNWCETEMFNATPSLTSIFRSNMILRRFYSFLVFDDDIFCFARQSSGGSDFASKAWEEWRWDETQNPKQFVKQDAPWSDVAPGVTKDMIDYFGLGSSFDFGDEGATWFWHPTKFGSRVLYILGAERYNIAPIAAFSAVNQNHHVKAVKIDLGGDDVRPYDIFAADDAVYIVAAKGTSTSTTVENSVWKSTDGVNFTKLFAFTATRPASAICYADGFFYFGMGANKYTKNAWASLGEDISGRIYRVRVPQAPVSVVPSASALSLAEGQTGTVSYTLSAAPATNMALTVRGAGRNADWTIDRKTLVFTPRNWNVPQTVAFSVEDFDSGDYTVSLVCGTGNADCDSANTVVAVTGRPFTAPTDPAVVTLFDTMTVGGTAGTAGSGVRILTDYVPKWDSIVRTKYAADPDANATQFLFCSREAWNAKLFAWAARIGNGQCAWSFNGTQHYSWDNVASADEVFLEVKNGDAVLTRLWDENHWYLTNNVPVQAFDPQYRMALFQSYTISGGNYGNWGNSFRGDFHYLQIFEDEGGGREVLKHHFVPCVVSNDVKVCDIADGNRIYDIAKASGGTVAIGAGAKAIGLVKPAVFSAFVSESEGFDWTNRLFTVSGLAAGTEVTLTLDPSPVGSGGSPAVESATADATGSAFFNVPTVPRAMYSYAIAAGDGTIASGTILAGGWDADGSWFAAAPDGTGGSAETGGSWAIPPQGTNATAYVVEDEAAFTLADAAIAAGSGRIARAESTLRYDFLNDASDTFADLEAGNSLAAVTPVANAAGKAWWKACVGGEWVDMDCDVAPAAGIDYRIRLECDFTFDSPRVRLSVSADGGATYSVLRAAAGAAQPLPGSEWLVPNDTSKRAFGGITANGASKIAGLRGELANAWVAETGGAFYASLSEALRAARANGGAVTLLTDATAPASLVAGARIDANGHLLVTWNDWRGTLLFLP